MSDLELGVSGDAGGSTPKTRARRGWVLVLMILALAAQLLAGVWLMIVFFISESETEDYVAGWEKSPYYFVAWGATFVLFVAVLQSTHVGGWLSDSTLWAAIFQFLAFFLMGVGLAYNILTLTKCFGSDTPQPIEQVACDDFQYVLWNLVFAVGIYMIFIIAGFFMALLDLATRSRFSVSGIFRGARARAKSAIGKVQAITQKGFDVVGGGSDDSIGSKYEPSKRKGVSRRRGTGRGRGEV